MAYTFMRICSHVCRLLRGMSADMLASMCSGVVAHANPSQTLQLTKKTHALSSYGIYSRDLYMSGLYSYGLHSATGQLSKRVRSDERSHSFCHGTASDNHTLHIHKYIGLGRHGLYSYGRQPHPAYPCASMHVASGPTCARVMRACTHADVGEQGCEWAGARACRRACACTVVCAYLELSPVTRGHGSVSEKQARGVEHRRAGKDMT